MKTSGVFVLSKIKAGTVTESRIIDINVPVLARVEGEGALALTVTDGSISSLQLRIYEPPRYFESLLAGRSIHEVIDVVARICGICPVAYQITAAHALEHALDIRVSKRTKQLRRVMYCGEWIQSHALHIHLLALPDFFGFDSAIAMAKDYPEEVKRGLFLQNAGNRLIKLLGGRSVHPVGSKIGGFFYNPAQAEISELISLLEEAVPQAEALIKWLADVDLGDNKQDFVSVALSHEDEYAIERGVIRASSGEQFDAASFDRYIKEFQVPHSTALHALFNGQPYLVGPLARLNLNFQRLPQPLQEYVNACGFHFPSLNMFHSIVARAIEIRFALDEAKRILTDLVSGHVCVEYSMRDGEGYAATEAPRGLLWHYYAISQDETIKQARIVPPTSQNQARIEEDLRLGLEFFGLDKDKDAIRLQGEKIIRNYDPCISCSTHFLKLDIHRE